MDNFVHLHVHTDYSLLDGHSTVPELVREVSRLDQPAVAMTDHGSIGGIRKFWKECNDAGIKPIIGCEFYVAPASRREKSAVYWGEPGQRPDDVSGQGAYTHGTVLATTDEGVRNLLRLYAASYADGFYRKPRIDLDLLATHNRGLITTTGCAGGAIPTLLRLEKYDRASAMVGTLRDIFGDRLYIEIMEHDNPIDAVINPGLINLARQHTVKLVATNDTHYTLAGDSYSHDALLCLQTGQKLNGTRTFKFEGNGYHVRSRQEMAEVFRELPEAIQSTLEIAERTEPYTVFNYKLRMPQAQLSPDLFSEDANEELHHVLPWNSVDETTLTRMKYEWETITTLGFADYFLILADLVKAAKRRKWRIGPGRGSVLGSLVAYKLGITGVDPLEHGLLFERFLNPERVSLPDIDIDIDQAYRGDFLALVREWYGDDYVAQMGTYGVIGAKSALHDAARVLGKSRYLSDGLTLRLPAAKFGRQPSLLEGDWGNLSDDEREVLDLAYTLEGKIRNQSTHASGVIISPEPIREVIPAMKPKGTEPWVTAFDMEDVENTGLVKMDFLGLVNLGVIDECMRMLGTNPQSGLPILSTKLSTKLSSLTDGRTFALLSEGKTLGVFQLDSPGMQQLLRSIKPDSFGDIAAVLALHRPGPMAVNAHHSYAKRKNGKEGVSFPHRDLERSLGGILGSTYGLIVFQEQVLEILKEVAGYTYSSAALIFDAMRKKDTAKMLAAKPDFVQRMKDRNYNDDCIESLWSTLVPFSDYSFNKSHSTGYGILVYWTAYLKANHPTEYMAAVLSREDDPKKLPIYLKEVFDLGIDILPPDINQSDGNWTPTSEGIRYGLSSIKGLAAKAYEYVTAKRPYGSLHDFFTRANAKALNGTTLSALIKSGALDSLCPHREDLLLAAPGLAERALADRALARKGQRPLAASPYEIAPATPTFDVTLRKEWEREHLGTVLTHEQISLTPTRWLFENEFYFIKTVVGQHPGRERLCLQLGYATVEVGYVDYCDELKRKLRSLGIFNIS